MTMSEHAILITAIDQPGMLSRLTKVLADHETEEILGCHIIGADAATLIQEVANAMRSRAGVDAILQSIYVHSALPEVVQRAFGGLPV